MQSATSFSARLCSQERAASQRSLYSLFAIRSLCAHRNACSSRSLPQNSSPSGGREARCAEEAEPLRGLGLRPQPRLDLVRLGDREHRLRVDLLIA